MVRKNRKPVWYKFQTKFCVLCGKNFEEGGIILHSMYCNICGVNKEKELKLMKKANIEWREYRSFCVKCSKPFQNGDPTLFGIFCTKCGKKWEKERQLRMQHQLRKARNIDPKLKMLNI